MLEMRPGCEECDTDLGPTVDDAYVCSFECTFCASCAANMDHVCRNCGGILLRRPPRPEALLQEHPAVTKRTFRPKGQ